MFPSPVARKRSRQEILLLCAANSAGALVALDAKTGKQIWKSYTISEPAKLTGKTATGVEVWGPAGASVWSSPTIDPQKNVIYFGTGVNYTQPGTKTSDALIALDKNTGDNAVVATTAAGRCL